MSDITSRVKQRKNVGKGKSTKSKENGENGVKVFENGNNGSRKPPNIKSSKTSFVVKTIFYLLLSVFVVVATLISIDYRTGHLKEAYETNIPPKVSCQNQS